MEEDDQSDGVDRFVAMLSGAAGAAIGGPDAQKASASGLESVGPIATLPER